MEDGGDEEMMMDNESQNVRKIFLEKFFKNFRHLYFFISRKLKQMAMTWLMTMKGTSNIIF